ncbi:MAG TPA: DUF3667 domain-containing protein [Rhodanobacteraceae bacterium]|nr:DUF3667 domain-containing protein [Rhodanobacteraceae bacterium]
MGDTPTGLNATQLDIGPPTSYCTNCGAELHGAYCHACGQSTKHLMKHVPALLGDAVDLVLNIDGRIVHTLPALYLRPGFLANEYFAGRRARYIPPFRLMFFLSVLAFLFIQLNLNVGDVHINLEPPPAAFADAGTPAQVQQQLDKQIQALEKSKAVAGELGAIGIEQGERALRRGAKERLRQLQGAPAKPATSALPPLSGSSAATAWVQRIAAAPTVAETQRLTHAAVADLDKADASAHVPAATRDRIFQAAGKRLDELRGNGAATGATHDDKPPTVHIGWLPAALNARLDAAIVRMRANLKQARTDPAARARVVAGMFAVLPQTMFVLLPLFAVLLKITYLFKRRLYIEHLMVALYSHAFIFLSLLLLALAYLARSAMPPWAATGMGWLLAAIWVWLPVYLLLMQKRVYRQGWLLTVVKYCFIGICYSVLLTFALLAAAVIGLTT